MRSAAHGQVVRTRRPATAPARQPMAEPLERRTLLSGLAGTYYDNADFTGASLTRIDPNVSFNWGTGSPDPSIGADTFSARWTGAVRAKFTERYTFSIVSDSQKARLWVDNRLIVDTWDNNISSGIIDLEVGRMYDIKVEYRNDAGPAGLKLQWKSASQPLTTIPTSMLYPPSTPAGGARALVAQPVGTAIASNYGAKGNGVADDATVLQKAIDDLPAYGTLWLEPRTYKLNKGLVIDKPLTVEGNGALLMLNTSAYPHNSTIMVISRGNSASTTWSENIVAGQSTFHPTFAPGTFTVGQWVAVELGHDPFDGNEEHFTAVAPVTEIGTNSVTLGTAAPYNINNGTRQHKIIPLDTLATQVHIRNLKFDHVDGTIPDTAIFAVRARNSTFDGISGRFNQVMIGMDCSNITLKNVNASLENGHSAAGRVFTAWGSLNMQVVNVKADTASDKAVFFVESWTRNTRFSNVNVRWRNPNIANSAVFHLTGGSTGTVADIVNIDNNNAGAVMLVGTGGQTGGFRFGRVNVRGSIKSLPQSVVDDLTLGQRRYATPIHVVRTIDLSSKWSNKPFLLHAGSYKSFKATTTHPGVVSILGLVNTAGKGVSTAKIATGSLDWTNEVGVWGLVNPLNDTAETMKTLQVYTPANVPAGAKLTIEYDYYPPS